MALLQMSPTLVHKSGACFTAVLTLARHSLLHLQKPHARRLRAVSQPPPPPPLWPAAPADAVGAATPFFFLFIALELGVAAARGRKVYNLRQTIK